MVASVAECMEIACVVGWLSVRVCCCVVVLLCVVCVVCVVFMYVYEMVLM